MINKIKKAALTTLATLLFFNPLKSAEFKLSNFKLSALASYNLCTPYVYFCSETNERFKKYTDIIGWQDLVPSTGISSFGIEAKIDALKFGKNNDFALNISAGYNTSSASFKNQQYNYHTSLRDLYQNFDESITLSIPSLGIGIEKNLTDKISLGGSLRAEQLNLSGNSLREMYLPQASNQYIPIECKVRGSDLGTAVQIEGKYQISRKNKNITASAFLGTRKGKVKAEYKGTVSLYIDGKLDYIEPWEGERNYSFDGTYFGGKLNYTFK